MTDGDNRPPAERARVLLRETESCTLATASSGGVPEAATIRFVADDDYTIYFNTSSTYRKYDNLTATPRVAVVVDGAAGNLQLEGRARELDGDEDDAAVDRYVEKYGHSPYLTHDHSTRFAVETDWARLLLDGSFPPEHAMILGEGETDLH